LTLDTYSFLMNLSNILEITLLGTTPLETTLSGTWHQLNEAIHASLTPPLTNITEQEHETV